MFFTTKENSSFCYLQNYKFVQAGSGFAFFKAAGSGYTFLKQLDPDPQKMNADPQPWTVNTGFQLNLLMRHWFRPWSVYRLTCSMAMLESMLVSGLPATAAQLLFALDMVCRKFRDGAEYIFDDGEKYTVWRIWSLIFRKRKRTVTGT